MKYDQKCLINNDSLLILGGVQRHLDVWTKTFCLELQTGMSQGPQFLTASLLDMGGKSCKIDALQCFAWANSIALLPSEGSPLARGGPGDAGD